MGRSIDRLLADFGHTLPTTPTTQRAKSQRVFPSAPSWRGRPKKGAGWVASRPPVRRYRMTSDQAGVFWPFLTGTPLPVSGAPMGTDMLSGATFYVDPHGWVLDDAVPVTNPNIFVFGKPGRGKSAWVKAFLNRMFAFGYQALILGDPKDEYEPMCRHFGVEPISIGPGQPARLNPLDPGPLATDWNHLTRAEHSRRVGIILGRQLQLLSSLISAQTLGEAKVPVGPTEAQILRRILEHLTHATTDTRGLRPIVIPEIWQHLHSPDQQLITDLRYSDRESFLRDTRLLRDAVAQLVSGPLVGIFDAPTTIRIDWDAPIQSLSLSRLMALGDDAIGMALMCLNSWGTAARQTSQRRRINVRDEVWRQLRLGTGAVASFDADLRLSRSNGDIEIANAHKPSDYLGAGHAGSQAQQIAKDLLHLADTRILFGQDPEIADDLEHLLDLGPTARDVVTGWAMNGKGRALACVGPRHYKVALTLHPDLEAPLTDTNQNITRNIPPNVPPNVRANVPPEARR